MGKVCIVAVGILLATNAYAQSVRIVGLGATTCARFLQEVRGKPLLERDYFAWAQGYMSGIVISAPPKVDESLNLAPLSFPLQEQAAYLRDFCATNPSADYSDGVLALYHKLGGQVGR